MIDHVYEQAIAELTRLRDERDQFCEAWKTTSANFSTLYQQHKSLLACVAQVEQEMRTIAMVAGQCSVEENDGVTALMAGAEAERCQKWADTLASLRNDQQAEHTCHDMNPPFPGPCLACGREKGQ